MLSACSWCGMRSCSSCNPTPKAPLPYHNLTWKYFGPFKVLQSVRQLAYKLDLPDDSHIYSVSQLKPFMPDYTPVFPELSRTTDLTAGDLTPVEILDHRMMKHGNGLVVQLKVWWSTLSPRLSHLGGLWCSQAPLSDGSDLDRGSI